MKTITHAMLAACGLVSTRKAAEYLGVSEDTVKKWRSGASSPRPGILEELSDLFGRIEQVADVVLEALEAMELPPGAHVAVELTTEEADIPCAAALMALARAQLVLGHTVRLELVAPGAGAEAAHLLRIPPAGSA